LWTSEVTGNREIFSVGVLPIDAPPLDPKTGAAQLTSNPGFANQDPEDSPNEEDASNRTIVEPRR
jgi:hypothetical protein